MGLERRDTIYFSIRLLYFCVIGPLAPSSHLSPLAATSPYSSLLQGQSLWCSRSSFLPVFSRPFARGSFLSLLGVRRLCKAKKRCLLCEGEGWGEGG